MSWKAAQLFVSASWMPLDWHRPDCGTSASVTSVAAAFPLDQLYCSRAPLRTLPTPCPWPPTGCPFSLGVTYLHSDWLVPPRNSITNVNWMHLPFSDTVAAFWLNPPAGQASLITWPLLHHQAGIHDTGVTLSWAFDAALIPIGCRAFLLHLSLPLLRVCILFLSFFYLYFWQFVRLSMFHISPLLLFSLRWL